MKLAVLTCAVFPSLEDAKRKLWIFLRSCEKFNIEPLLYGVGRTFPAYRMMMLDWQLEYLKTIPGDYTHVLFTDGWDAFFTGPMDEIIRKYERMGSPPILCSAFHQLANVADVEQDYPNCFESWIYNRYPNRGGYLGEIPAMVEAFDRMLRALPDTGDDCFNWYLGWKEGWFRPKLDFQCEIFKVSDSDAAVRDGRLMDITNGRYPCILHLSGGYTDPIAGKDDRMIPWARRLGIIE